MGGWDAEGFAEVHPTLPSVVDFGLGIEVGRSPAVIERGGQIWGKHAGAVRPDVEVVAVWVSQVHLRAGEGGEGDREMDIGERREREERSEGADGPMGDVFLLLLFLLLLRRVLLLPGDSMTAALSSLIPVMMFAQELSCQEMQLARQHLIPARTAGGIASRDDGEIGSGDGD